MGRFLEVALSSFWSFLGTLIIMLVVFIVIMGLLGVFLQTRRQRRTLTEADIIKIVREGMDLGKLDAPISRLIKRNEQRGGR
ncbi:hypothetical protein [Aminobacter aminovorans]|uniref:Membrane protein n=1 Tax=Aminobacter aminovorans TaxID=83263 RepID=A0AAC9FDH4_AMIAI|nr:hypothetical protein [Aminobacter aminovorans]AMS41222.1 hypothetical protein AA2016_2294 [Aminobacter aminovorans]MBB3705795.1 putative membrane protein [Aminobacter aminovorans]